MIDLCEYNETVPHSEFKAKVDSLFMMLYISIMTDNLKRISHLVDETLLNKYQDFLDELNSRNERQMYDLLNVESTEVQHTSIKNNKTVLDIKLVVNYMDYVVDKTTKEIIRGNNTSRIEKTIILTLEENYHELNSYDYISNIENFDWKLIDLKEI